MKIVSDVQESLSTVANSTVANKLLVTYILATYILLYFAYQLHSMKLGPNA